MPAHDASRRSLLFGERRHGTKEWFLEMAAILYKHACCCTSCLVDSSPLFYHLFHTFFQSTLFKRIEKENSAAAESLLKSKLSIRFRCSQPTADILIDARKKPVQIAYGSTDIKPTLDINLSADTLHEILLGDIGLSKAMGSKRMKPKGPIWKSVVLEPLLHDAQKLYPEVLKQCIPISSSS